MEIIKFKNVSFKYIDEDGEELSDYILKDYSINLPHGVISLVGQNATGKSTFLLLAGALLYPIEGDIFIYDKNTKDLKDLRERQSYVSFIYQNMEFETEENIGDLLHYVYENGYYQEKKEGFIKELIDVFELSKILNRKTQEVSKGELQRTIIAFSLLYGSKIVMMDEPIFALEERQKEKVLDYLFNFSKNNNISFFYSLHDIDLSKKYSEYTLLFYRDKMPEFGPTEKILTREKIEEAYEIPFSFLRSHERSFREALMRLQREEENKNEHKSD